MGKNRFSKKVDQLPNTGQLRSNEKKKTNSAPKDLDMQEIPFKLREIMKSKMQINKPRKRRKKNIERQVPKSEEIQTDIPIPKFKRRKRESVGAYLDRMDRAAKHVMFLSKNQPDLEPEKEEEGEKEMEIVPPEKSQSKKAFHRRKVDKALKKKEEKEVTRLEDELFTDKVQFGEVAMEPPSLTAKPRKSPINAKPGEKQLLLKKLFDKGTAPTKQPTMSLARKRLIEEERERVIKAYREMKKRKLQDSTDKGL
ncbi:coiled-coil domain-containing protein 137 [Pelodytes ibericus]